MDGKWSTKGVGEDSTTTENGTYNLNGATSGCSCQKHHQSNTGAAPTFYIPSENEWYKAAYYNGAEHITHFATQNNTFTWQ